MYEARPLTSAKLPRTFAAASYLLLLATLCSIVIFVARGAGLRFVSGTWTALAVDAAHGTIYRPIMGPLGYGGSRYMPLHFVLHGGLIRLIGDPLYAGYFITLLSAMALFSGVYLLLRALEVEQRWARYGVVLALGSLAVQLAITTVRGDLLSAALNVWGLALLARQKDAERIRISIPALFFVLAFSGKLTTLFGLAAGVVTLACAGRRNAAIRMACTGAFGMFVVGAVTYAVSSGRVIESMRVTGSGGAGVVSLLEAPLRLLYFACNDLAFLPVLIATIAALFPKHRVLARDWATQILLWTLAATLFIYGSPGTDFNHLLDLHIACVVYLIVRTSQGNLQKFPDRVLRIAGPFAAIVIIGANVALLFIFPGPLQIDRRNAFNVAHSEYGPVLSEDPWVPIVAGERPYNLDSFNLRLACMQDTRVRDDLWARIARYYFAGIVLTPVETPGTRAFDLNAKWYGVPYYGGVHFPPGFIEQVYRYYEPAARFHSYLVLKPRKH